MQRLLQRRVVAVLVLALLVAVVPRPRRPRGLPRPPSPAAARRPAGRAHRLKGDGEPGSGSDLSSLAEDAGVWAVLFDDGPGGELAVPAAPTAAPATPSPGPSRTGPAPRTRCASSCGRTPCVPVTFMASGQRVLDGTTKGGWFRAGDGLRLTLVNLGLPSRQPLTASTGHVGQARGPGRPAVGRRPDRGRARPGARGLASGGRRAGAPPGRGRRRPVPAPPVQPRRRHDPVAARRPRSGRARCRRGRGTGPSRPQGWMAGSSVNSTPRRRSSSKVAWMSSRANTSPGVNGTTEVSGGRRDLHPAPRRAHRLVRRFSKPSRLT